MKVTRKPRPTARFHEPGVQLVSQSRTGHARPVAATPNLSFDFDVLPLIVSYSFSDGVQTVTDPLPVSVSLFGTNGAGEINAWRFSVNDGIQGIIATNNLSRAGRVVCRAARGVFSSTPRTNSRPQIGVTH
jgi:hypothetical protein